MEHGRDVRGGDIRACASRGSCCEPESASGTREFGLSRNAVPKMLQYAVPPGYQRQQPIERPKLGPWLGVIDAILNDDKLRPAKQRHTSKRIFDRLKKSTDSRAAKLDAVSAPAVSEEIEEALGGIIPCRRGRPSLRQRKHRGALRGFAISIIGRSWTVLRDPLADV